MMHYLLVSDLITEAEFEDRMEKKSQEFAGILDEVTVAMMVVDDLGRAHIKIGDIPKAETSIVSFYGKVLAIDGPKEISREGEEEPGAVASLVLGDITGTTKMTLWDEKAKAVLELHEGDVLEVIAKPRRGRKDVGFVAMRESSVEIVETKRPPKSEVMAEPLTVKVLSISPVKEITKKDGSIAFLQVFVVGDASGTARLVSWLPDVFADVSEGASITIKGVTRFEDDGLIEYTAADSAEVSFCGHDIEVLTIDADDAGLGVMPVVTAEVVSVMPTHTFINRRGNESRVKNLKIRGKKGRLLSAALWGDMADTLIFEGDAVEIINAEAKPGRYTELEFSVGYGAAVRTVSREAAPVSLSGRIQLRKSGMTFETGDAVFAVSSCTGDLPEPGMTVSLEGTAVSGRIMIENWEFASVSADEAAKIRNSLKCS